MDTSIRDRMEVPQEGEEKVLTGLCCPSPPPEGHVLAVQGTEAAEQSSASRPHTGCADLTKALTNLAPSGSLFQSEDSICSRIPVGIH